MIRKITAQIIFKGQLCFRLIIDKKAVCIFDELQIRLYTDDGVTAKVIRERRIKECTLEASGEVAKCLNGRKIKRQFQNTAVKHSRNPFPGEDGRATSSCSVMGRQRSGLRISALTHALMRFRLQTEANALQD